MSEKGLPPEAPKEFEQIKDRTEAEHLLKEAVKALASAMIWTKDQGLVVRTNISRHELGDAILGTRIPRDFDLKKFLGALSASGTNDCYFSVSLPWANIFFKAPFLGHDVEGLRFRIPQNLFKVQRRKDLRFRIPEGHTFKVEFNDPNIQGIRMERKVFDISASGFSFLIAPEEEASYPAGLELRNVVIPIAGRDISTEGQVRHHKALTVLGKPAIKVGVVFTAIRPGDSQKIASFVFEESRKYFLRFV